MADGDDGGVGEIQSKVKAGSEKGCGFFAAELDGGKHGKLPPRTAFAATITGGAAAKRSGNTGGKRRRCNGGVPPQFEGGICGEDCKVLNNED